jgi:hypothetical protein
MSHTLGSSMSITVAAPRIVSASTCATRSPLPSPVTRLSIDPDVSVGRCSPVRASRCCSLALARLLSASERIMDPMPKPAPVDSRFFSTRVITPVLALIRCSSASSSEFKMAVRSTWSAAMRFWASRKARWMIIAAAALLERLAGVSIAASRYARHPHLRVTSRCVETSRSISPFWRFWDNPSIISVNILTKKQSQSTS